MSILVSFAFGCALFLIFLTFINYRSRVAKETLRLDWDNKAGQELTLKAAGVARDMAPLFRNLTLLDAKISIVGGDGQYILSAKGKKLEASVKEWAEAGSDVTYILLDAPSRVKEKFLRLQDEISRSDVSYSGSFLVRFFDSDGCDDTSSLELLRKFRTHHPTIIETVDGLAMWLEGFHPDDSIYAYNVRFIPPSVTQRNGEIEKLVRSYQFEVETLAKSCH